MEFGVYPWLFLIPPLLIVAGGLFVYVFSRTELGQRRARYVRAKYGIVTGKEAEAERERLKADADETANADETDETRDADDVASDQLDA